MMDNINYVKTTIHVNSRHGEIIHFRKFDLDTNVDVIIRRLMNEMTNKEITKIQMDKHYE